MKLPHANTHVLAFTYGMLAMLCLFELASCKAPDAVHLLGGYAWLEGSVDNPRTGSSWDNDQEGPLVLAGVTWSLNDPAPRPSLTPEHLEHHLAPEAPVLVPVETSPQTTPEPSSLQAHLQAVVDSVWKMSGRLRSAQSKLSGKCIPARVPARMSG